MVEYCNSKAEALEQPNMTVLDKFGREKLAPIMMLISDQLSNAIENNHLYSLEILCNSTRKLGFQNSKETEQKLCQLRNEAEYVTNNLTKVLNMKSENEYELNDVLDICLSKARNIGMRGELIDTANKHKGEFDEDKFNETEFFTFHNEDENHTQDEELLKLFTQIENDYSENDISLSQSINSKSDIQSRFDFSNISKELILMKENKKFLPNQTNGKFGIKKNETNNIGGKSNANKSIRMADSIASHDSETAKRISQDLTLKFISSINRADAKKNFNKSEISQNEKESDSKIQKNLEGDARQSQNIVPSAIKNDPVADKKIIEKSPQVISSKESSENKSNDKSIAKIDLQKNKEQKEVISKTPQVNNSDIESQQLNFSALAGNLGLRPRRNLTKVVEEAEDEKQSPRNTNKNLLDLQLKNAKAEKINENPASDESENSDSDNQSSNQISQKSPREETKQPKIINGNKPKVNNEETKEPKVVREDKDKEEKKIPELNHNGTTSITPAVNLPKKEEKTKPIEEKPKIFEEKQKQTKMNRMKELFELNKEKEALKEQQKADNKQKISHNIRNLEKAEKKEDLMKKIDDAFDELPSSSDSQDEDESGGYD